MKMSTLLMTYPNHLQLKTLMLFKLTASNKNLRLPIDCNSDYKTRTDHSRAQDSN